jgi:hypothetical protein
MAYFFGDVAQVDLMDLTGEHDPHYKYILMVIDVFTRKLFTEKLKTKNKSDIDNAFRKIFTEYKPNLIHCDQEPAIIHSDYLKSENIKIYHTPNSEHGAGIVERAIRTMKLKIETERDKLRNRNFPAVIKLCTNNFNNSINRTMGRSPNEAVKKPFEMSSLWKEKANELKKDVKNLYKVGDNVVTVLNKNPFRKESKFQWGNIVYTIEEVKDTNPSTYKLKHKIGSFYHQQLQKVEGKITEPKKPNQKNSLYLAK